MSNYFYIISLLVWPVLAYFAFKKRRDNNSTSLLLTTLAFGPFGLWYALSKLNKSKVGRMGSQFSDVAGCTHCGWLYKPSEYKAKNRIACPDCSKIIKVQNSLF